MQQQDNDATAPFLFSGKARVGQVGGCYVQIGAGFSHPAGWLNYDASPTLRIQKAPLLGRRIAKLAGNDEPFPEDVLFGDAVKGLPLPAGSADGIYASHVLEHLALEDMRAALRNCFELLRPGGILRLIVPDLLQRAKAYTEAAETGDAEAAHRFMTGTMLGIERRPSGWLGRLRTLFGNSAHLWMWDYAAMEQELRRAGFEGIRPAHFHDSGDPMFDAVEDETRFLDGEFREVAVQAAKPQGPAARK